MFTFSLKFPIWIIMIAKFIVNEIFQNKLHYIYIDFPK